MVATFVAVALLAAACSGDADGGATTAGEVTTDGITGNVSIRVTDVNHPVSGDDVEPIGDVVTITTDGTVEDGATVTIDAGEPIGDEEIVVAVTAESEDGPWEPLPVAVDGSRVTASIEHLSWFSFLRFPDPTDIVEELFNDVTSNLFAAATSPSCEDQDGARTDGYEIGSEGPDVLMWCLGRDGEGRYLRVVNNRRYPVILSSSLPVREIDETRGLGDRLSEALAGDQVALPPRAQVTYAADLEPDGAGRVQADFDGLAYSLYQLQFGVELAGAFLTRFGTEAAASRSIDALLANAGCVDALVAVAPGRILTSCLDYDGLSAIFGSLGAAIATPIILTAGVLSFFQTAARSLWDEISGRDNYTITLVNRAPAPTTTTAPPSNPVLIYSVEDCRRDGLPEYGDVERAAICLWQAYQAGDRGLAAGFADPPAIDELFAHSPAAQWRFGGCTQDSSQTSSSWLGHQCWFNEPDPGGLHGVGYQMVFTAYDDVVVVSNVFTVG